MNRLYDNPTFCQVTHLLGIYCFVIELDDITEALYFCRCVVGKSELMIYPYFVIKLKKNTT